MEGTEHTNANFVWLMNADISFISTNISKEHALSICAYAVEHEQVTASEVLALWMSKLKSVYVFENFCEVDWRRLTLCCKHYFEKSVRINNVYNDTDVGETFYRLRHWLETSNTFIERVRSPAKKLHITGICLFLKFILDTVQKCCAFFQLNSRKLDWKSQIETINTLHSFSIQLVWDCLEESGEISRMDYCAIIPFINMICLSTAENSFMGIKTKVEIWKYLAKFTSGFAEYKHNLTESKWPKLPMNVLIQEVKRNILLIYKKESNEDIQYVEPYLRVTGFYVKILNKMTTVFQHSNFPIAKDFFDLLLMTLTAPTFLHGNTVLTLVKKHVSSGLTNILPLVFKNSEFLQLASNHVEESADLCYELVVAYLYACIHNDNVDFLMSNAELFKKIFKRMFQGRDIFVHADHFDEIIYIYTTFVLLDPSQAFLHDMQQFVVKGNTVLSFASTEVLILASSCVDDACDVAMNRLVFWVQTKNRFARFSSNSKCLNVDRLVGHYFKLCFGKISKSEIRTQLRGCISSLTNCSILRYIKDNINDPNLESSSVIISKKFCKLLEAHERNGISIEDYYETIAYMYELLIYKADIPEGLLQKIADLLEKVWRASRKNEKLSFKRLFSAGLGLLSKSNITDETHLKVLGILKDAVDSGRNLKMVSFWLILEVCCNQQNDSSIYNAAQSIFDSIELPEIIQVSIFEKSAQTTCTVAVESQFYRYIEETNIECAICLKPYCAQRKRSRREMGYDEDDLDGIIQNVGHMVKKIHDLSKRLKKCHVEKLNNVCMNIQKIADEHKNEE